MNIVDWKVTKRINKLLAVLMLLLVTGSTQTKASPLLKNSVINRHGHAVKGCTSEKISSKMSSNNVTPSDVDLFPKTRFEILSLQNGVEGVFDRKKRKWVISHENLKISPLSTDTFIVQQHRGDVPKAVGTDGKVRFQFPSDTLRARNQRD